MATQPFADRIIEQLRLSDGLATGSALRAAVPDLSQSSFSRLIESQRDKIAVLGRKRAARYALLRDLRGLGTHFPVYAVDEAGAVTRAGTLTSLWAGRYWFQREGAQTGHLYDDIPYFIDDMRPQGFLGRGFGARYPELNLPPRVTDWNPDDVMFALLNRGEDNPGALVVGEASLQRLLSRGAEPVIALEDRATQFDALAQAALSGQVPGSSAGGEQLKFTAVLTRASGRESEPQRAIIKFSPPLTTLAGRRWADLLICESLAAHCALEAGIPAAHAQMLITAQRAYLQVDRFDRIGLRGRRGLVSLGALDDEHFGARNTSYAQAAHRLQGARLIDSAQAEHLRWISAFGTLIANTDMHYGNVSLFFNLEERVSLAPMYDMLPMLYAPVGDEVLPREFTPQMPDTASASQWQSASAAACTFWRLASEDARISDPFRAIAAQNFDKVNTLAQNLASFKG